MWDFACFLNFNKHHLPGSHSSASSLVSSSVPELWVFVRFLLLFFFFIFVFDVLQPGAPAAAVWIACESLSGPDDMLCFWVISAVFTPCRWLWFRADSGCFAPGSWSEQLLSEHGGTYIYMYIYMYILWFWILNFVCVSCVGLSCILCVCEAPFTSHNAAPEMLKVQKHHKHLIISSARATSLAMILFYGLHLSIFSLIASDDEPAGPV